VTPLLQAVLDVQSARRRLLPLGRVPAATAERRRRHRLRARLLAQYNVTVLPGSLLAREAHGVNPAAAASAWRWWPKRRVPRSRPAHRLLHQGAVMSHGSAIDHRLGLGSARTPQPDQRRPEIRNAVERVIADLNGGRLRVAERQGVGQWVTHQWIKKAVLLSFRLNDNQAMHAGDLAFYDQGEDQVRPPERRGDRGRRGAHRPPAVARRGSFIGRGAILMPSYVNIGAYVDEGTMVDTWATVGSCAQIGKNVHLSGGVGIGGVLEPLQANPTIIEDNCFIGARSEIVEGVIVEENSVIAMGVFIGQSTKIYDRRHGEEMHYGRVPAGSVVVSGYPARPRRQLQPVLRRDRQARRLPQTRAKTSINELLRCLSRTLPELSSA
jgi:2,3,4,5-tetrahydropyridine-2-carboxylate N-succinyltransferase